MKFTAKQYASAFFAAVSESRPQDQDRVLDNFALILRQNGDLDLIDKIEEEYHAAVRTAAGVTEASVTTAKPLGAGSERELLQKLNDYVGGKVELKARVDDGLVGGVVIRVGDELIDGSVARSLRDLRKELIK